jgi:hypothetical protein
MLRTIWRNNDRYLAAYWEKFNNRYYVAGDSAHRDKDGYYWIMGRIDDVLNVAGHRLGTMEVESALVAHPRIAEAAVVGKPHEIKGESVFAFVVCRGARPTGDTSGLVKELREWVAEQLGAIAKPDDIRFADNLPKTRSGKIMRRLLKAVARGEEITQDVSTLENPAILDQLRGVDTGATAPGKAAAGGQATRRAKSSRTPARGAKKPVRAKAANSKGARKASGRAAAGRGAGSRGAAGRTSAARNARAGASASSKTNRARRKAAKRAPARVAARAVSRKSKTAAKASTKRSLRRR